MLPKPPHIEELYRHTFWKSKLNDGPTILCLDMYDLSTSTSLAFKVIHECVVCDTAVIANNLNTVCDVYLSNGHYSIFKSTFFQGALKVFKI